MASVKEAIVQGIREWAKEMAQPAGATLTDLQVIPADDEGTRPAKDYLTVKVLVSSIKDGVTDQKLRWYEAADPAETPLRKNRGVRHATVEIQGFGEDTARWIENLHDTLEMPAANRILRQHLLTVYPISGMNDISALLAQSTTIEARYQMDFRVDYRVETPTEEQVELATVDVDVDYRDDSPAPDYDGDFDITV